MAGAATVGAQAAPRDAPHGVLKAPRSDRWESTMAVHYHLIWGEYYGCTTYTTTYYEGASLRQVVGEVRASDDRGACREVG